MYTKICNILDTFFHDQWFLDSGSLLGVVRNGQFLKQDQGIDISILVESYDSTNIAKAINQFEKLGFITSRYNWGDTIYKYCLSVPYKNSFTYAIDLHLFTLHDRSFYCPQVSLSLKGVQASFASIRKGDVISNWGYTLSGLKVFVATVYRYVFKYFGVPMKMRQYASKGKGKTYLWRIPVQLFHGTQRSSFHNLRILKQPESYLTYRYNNWRIPVTNWDTLRDDGGIITTDMETIDRLVGR